MNRGSGRPVRVRIMLADDHELWRAAVRQPLESAGMEVVAEASTLDEARVQAGRHAPDVILLDTTLSGIACQDVLAALAPASPSTRIVMLAASSEDAEVLAAVRHGAAGYLTKDIPQEALVRAIQDAQLGRLAMSRATAAMVLVHLLSASAVHPDPIRADRLSERQEEIIAFVAEGMSDSEIAARLTLSSRTIEGHVGAIIRKLGARDRADAARRWFGEHRQAASGRRPTRSDRLPARD